MEVEWLIGPMIPMFITLIIALIISNYAFIVVAV